MLALGILEDDGLLRMALTEALAGQNYSVAISEGDVESFLKKASTKHLDAVVLDLHLGAGATGADVALKLTQIYPSLGIVILSSFEDPRLLGVELDDLPKGAIYVQKSSVRDIRVLASAIEDAIRKADSKTTMSKQTELHKLTKSQLEIVRLVSRGLSNSEIARMRSISEKTVEATLTRIIKNLGIQSGASQNQRVHLARAYFRSRGVQIED